MRYSYFSCPRNTTPRKRGKKRILYQWHMGVIAVTFGGNVQHEPFLFVKMEILSKLWLPQGLKEQGWIFRPSQRLAVTIHVKNLGQLIFFLVGLFCWWIQKCYSYFTHKLAEMLSQDKGEYFDVSSVCFYYRKWGMFLPLKRDAYNNFPMFWRKNIHIELKYNLAIQFKKWGQRHRSWKPRRKWFLCSPCFFTAQFSKAKCTVL